MSNVKASWLRTGTLIVLLLGLLGPGGCGPLVLSVDDTVVMNGGRVPLVAHISREHMLGLRSEIEQGTVSFFVDGRKVGENEAGEEGRAAVTVDRLEGNATQFTARAQVQGRTLEATGRIFRWQKERVSIAVDIDHTVSNTNYRLLLLKEEVNVSSPIPGAKETLTELANDYYILYLTARPRFLFEKTRDWLSHYGFPAGPVVAAPRVRDAMRQLQFKQRMLYGLREAWPQMLIGIGNRTADIEAYASNHMLPVIVYNGGEEMHYSDAVVLQDWQFVHKFFRANREILTNPAETRKVIDGRVMVLQPLVPFEGSKWHYTPKPFAPGD